MLLRLKGLGFRGRDIMFAAGARSRFKLPGRKKNRCSKLIVDGEVIISPQSLMEVWAQYFSNLAKSKDESPGLQELQQTVDAVQSLGMEDYLLHFSQLKKWVLPSGN